MRQLAVVVWLVAACGGGGGATPDGAFDGSAVADALVSPDAAVPSPDAAPEVTDLARLRALVDALPSASNRTALVEAFFTAVAYGANGLPIVEDGQLGVAFLADSVGSYTVAGDFNGWTQVPLTQPAAGFPFYYAILDVASPTGKYKFVAGGSSFFADPRARRYGWDEFGEYSAVATTAARLERYPRFPSTSALDPRTISIFVPAGPAPATGYRVVYMHDGQNLFDPEAIWGGWHAWEAAESAVAAGVDPFLIVAIPNSDDRIDEYTPVTEQVGGSVMGGRADEYVAFLVDEVKPFVDARYPTRAGPADTAVVGSSLGGVISYYALLVRPDVFGHAGSLSGAFWFGSGTFMNPTLMHMYADTPPPASSTFYLDSGGDDGGGCLDSDGDGVSDDGFDSDGYCQTLDMLDVLQDLGFSPIYDHAPGAPHNEAAWSARLPDVFIDWFPGNG